MQGARDRYAGVDVRQLLEEHAAVLLKLVLGVLAPRESATLARRHAKRGSLQTRSPCIEPRILEENMKFLE